MSNPATTAQALVNSSFSVDELRWAEPLRQETPDDPGVLYQITTTWSSGLLVFQIYESYESEEAVLATHLRRLC